MIKIVNTVYLNSFFSPEKKNQHAAPKTLIFSTNYKVSWLNIANTQKRKI